MIFNSRVIVVFISAFVASLSGIRALSHGDIILLSFNGNTDSFKFATVTEVPKNSKIRFIEHMLGEDGSFKAGDGYVEWTANDNLPKGSIISYDDSDPTPDFIQVGEFDLPQDADRVVAYDVESSEILGSVMATTTKRGKLRVGEKDHLKSKDVNKWEIAQEHRDRSPSLMNGDITLLKFNGNTDSFSFITMVEIKENTKIKFFEIAKDKDNNMVESDGFVLWTALDKVPRGTIFDYDDAEMSPDFTVVGDFDLPMNACRLIARDAQTEASISDYPRASQTGNLRPQNDEPGVTSKKHYQVAQNNARILEKVAFTTSTAEPSSSILEEVPTGREAFIAEKDILGEIASAAPSSQLRRGRRSLIYNGDSVGDVSAPDGMEVRPTLFLGNEHISGEVATAAPSAADSGLRRRERRSLLVTDDEISGEVATGAPSALGS